MLMRHATRFADITTSEWYYVARRVRQTQSTDGWEWHIPPADVSALDVAEKHQRVITTHQKLDGRTVMVARLVHSKPPTGGEIFALAGRGMFEQ